MKSYSSSIESSIVSKIVSTSFITFSSDEVESLLNLLPFAEATKKDLLNVARNDSAVSITKYLVSHYMKSDCKNTGFYTGLENGIYTITFNGEEHFCKTHLSTGKLLEVNNLAVNVVNWMDRFTDEFRAELFSSERIKLKFEFGELEFDNPLLQIDML